ncbi:MAG: bifunctional folylpolyglutamate synthase/dihydrofolate synthase [Tuberibacillus sp.]
MAIRTQKEAEDLVYDSFMRAKDFIPHADDSITRDIELTRKLLSCIDNPERGGRYILVTGSKGKGSTARLIASILTEHGFKVGLFTSPHLIDFRERIRINGEMISEREFIEMMKPLEKPVLEMDRDLSKGKYIGPIGIALAAALLYFKKQNTDINVIECGRGGRYDETNVLDNEYAVLTPIMAEHIGPLGQSVYDICQHKLGIIKESVHDVFIGRQKETLLDYIQSKLSNASQSISIFGQAMKSSDAVFEKGGIRFDVKTDLTEYNHLSLPSLATFQADNAATAIKVCEKIYGGPLDYFKMQTAIQKVDWSGRCEIISKEPFTILDGAINRASAEYLNEMVAAIKVNKVVSIIAVPKDKDYRGVIETCQRFTEHLIITEGTHSHKTFPGDAVEIAQKYDPKAARIIPFSAAFNQAVKLNPDLILVIGTQTFIGEVKQVFKSVK